VSKLADLDRLFAQIESEKGRLDVLFTVQKAPRGQRQSP